MRVKASGERKKNRIVRKRRKGKGYKDEKGLETGSQCSNGSILAGRSVDGRTVCAGGYNGGCNRN